MKQLLVIFSLLVLVLSQSSTGSNTDSTTDCPNLCYEQNTSPCPFSTFSCLRSTLTEVKVGCEYVCVNKTSNSASGSANFTTDFQECKYPCQQQDYKCSSDEECVYDTNSTCNLHCRKSCNTTAACLVAPCSVDQLGKDCVGRLINSNPTFASPEVKCVDNYCGGCTAEWYINGVRVCQNPPKTCSDCSDVCPNGTVRVLDPSTGCPKCGACRVVCKTDLICPAIACPYGRRLDSNGCPTCDCNPCPDLTSSCNLACPNGYIIDNSTKCKRCECNPIACPLIYCLAKCEFGTLFDERGCPTCNCTTCSKPLCSADKVCLNGYKRDSNGCPTCDCYPPCTISCPDGYVDAYYSATADSNAGAISINNSVCRCKCKTLNCLVGCPNGYVIDKFGCQTCECVPKPDDCPKITCDIACQYGYIRDSKGCQTCQCNNGCRILNCTATDAVNCIYGSLDEYKCPTCKCNPCPAVLCSLKCLYGYAVDPKTGCPGCECRPAPDCKVGTNSVDAATICPLACVKGLSTKDGCPTCNCSTVTPCTCGPKPTDKPILCADKKTTVAYTDVCFRDSDKNLCYYLRTSCPYGFIITVPKASDLTPTDIAKIIAKIGTTSADVTYTKEEDGNNYKYTFWVSKDSLPPEKSATDVNTEIDSSVKESHPDGSSFILSDGSTPAATGFGNIIVPIFGFLLIALFI